MSRLTRPRRYIARPVTVVIRTVGEDAIAWNKADGTKLRLPPGHATLLSSIPTRWVDADDVAEPRPGMLQQLISARLVVERTAERDEGSDGAERAAEMDRPTTSAAPPR